MSHGTRRGRIREREGQEGCYEHVGGQREDGGGCWTSHHAPPVNPTLLLSLSPHAPYCCRRRRQNTDSDAPYLAQCLPRSGQGTLLGDSPLRKRGAMLCVNSRRRKSLFERSHLKSLAPPRTPEVTLPLSTVVGRAPGVARVNLNAHNNEPSISTQGCIVGAALEASIVVASIMVAESARRVAGATAGSTARPHTVLLRPSECPT